MSISFNEEYFEELERSPRWSVDRESGHSGEREFCVLWDQANAFVLAMQQAYFPGVQASVVQRINVEPFVANPREKQIVNLLTDMNEHEFARVTIQYSAQSGNGTREQQNDGTYISYRQGTTVEFQTVPSRSLVWDDNSEPVSPDAYSAMPISKTDHVLTWSEVANPPLALISSMKGKVNQGRITIPKIGLEVGVEQLYFESAESSTKIDASGDELWEFTYTLKEVKPSAFGADGEDVGWNHQYRDDPAGWVKVKDKDSGQYTFATADLSLLFEQA